MKNKTLIPMILTTLCISLSASAAGPAVNPANGMMYYNAVAQQQKTNILGMATENPDLLTSLYESYLKQSHAIQEQLQYLAAKGDNMTAEDKDQIRLLLYQYEQTQKSASDLLQQLNKIVNNMAERTPRSAMMAVPPVAIDRSDFHIDEMFAMLEDATRSVKEKLQTLRDKGGSISIADMFEMQMMMNKLSQLSEMSTSVISAANSAISSMARNVKS